MRLTATDALGLSHTASVTIEPLTATLLLTSDPSGAELVVDGLAQRTPFSMTAIAGSSHSLSATSPQTLEASSYDFASWSNGSAGAQQITLTTGTTALHALFARSCGNGALQAGEACDDGNRSAGDCCSPSCTFEAAGDPCAEDSQRCTLDVCDGAGACSHPVSALCFALGQACDEDLDCESGHCVDDVCCDDVCGGGESACQACSVARGAASDGECVALAEGTPCRAADGACDQAEVCDGVNGACPDDGPAEEGTACDDDDPCTQDGCDGEGRCRATPIAGCCVEDGDCDDRDPCTRDACAEAGGACTHEPEAECCEDGERCGEPMAGRGGGGSGAVGAGDGGAADGGLVDGGVADGGRKPERDAGADAGEPPPRPDDCDCAVPGASPAHTRRPWLLAALVLVAVMGPTSAAALARYACSGRRPADSSIAMSSSRSGFGVVSSFSPKKIELAPARKHSSCASLLSAVRPAESRTRACGITIRAAAHIRTSSNGSSGGRSASGVPATGASALIGTLSGGGSRFASVASMRQRSSIDSPMPRMPPQHTWMPARLHARERLQPLVVGAGRDDRAVELARGVEVVVVRGQPGVGEPLRLLVGQHARA